jgi:hypothetical protein
LYPGEQQELKQESEQGSLHGAPIKVYVDYRRAPALLEIRIHRKSGTEVRYGDLRIKVLDEKGERIPLWKGWATSDWMTSGFVPGVYASSPVKPDETVLTAVYLLQVAGGQHAAAVDLEWSGEKEEFPVFASNHGFGYRLDE